jgi:hypothetical protein
MLFPWLGAHQRQPAIGIKLLSTLESFFLAVGLELNGGASVLGVDDQFVEQAHSYWVGTWVVAMDRAINALALLACSKKPQAVAQGFVRSSLSERQPFPARTSQNAATTTVQQGGAHHQPKALDPFEPATGDQSGQ